MNTIARPRTYAIAAIGQDPIGHRVPIVRRAIRANARVRIAGRPARKASVTSAGRAMRADRNPIVVLPVPAMGGTIEARDPIGRARIGGHEMIGRRAAVIGPRANGRETETRTARADPSGHRTRNARAASSAHETRIVRAASSARETRIGRVASHARKTRIVRAAAIVRHTQIGRATRTVRAKTGARETIGRVTTTVHNNNANVRVTPIGVDRVDRIVRAVTGNRRSIAGLRRTGRSSNSAVRIPTGRNSIIGDRHRIIRRGMRAAGAPIGRRVAIADLATSTDPTRSVQRTIGRRTTASHRQEHRTVVRASMDRRARACSRSGSLMSPSRDRAPRAVRAAS